MSLRPVAEALESNARAADFTNLARLLIAHRGDLIAAQMAAEKGYSPRVQTILKSAVAAGSTADATWAGALAEYSGAVTAFVESLRHVGVFDRILADGAMRRVPLQGRGAVVTGSLTADVIGQAMVTPVSSLEFSPKTLAPRKALGLVVASAELLKLASPGTQALFASELRKAVAAATDREFLAALYASTTPTGSAGSTLANITTDLGVLLGAVTSGANSRLYFVIDPTNAKKLALKANNVGAPAFPNFGPNGGEIIPGVTGIVSNDLPSGGALLMDGTQILGDSENILLDVFRHGSLQFETAPDSPPSAGAVLRNLWQEGNAALMAERWFGFSVGRTTAVASLSGVSY